MPRCSSTSSMASRRSTAKVPCWQTSRRPAPKPSCCRARCCETAAASSGTTASGSYASSTPPAIRSVPSHSRPIALKGAVTAFLEAMLGVVPRLGVSLALIIAHEDQRPALASLATGGRPDPTGGARGHGETCRGGARAHGLRRGGRTTRLIGALSGEREALVDLGHELRDFDRFELLSRRAGARFTGGCTRVKASARIPLCRSAQLTGAAIGNPGRARGEKAPTAVVPRPLRR